MLEDFIYAYRRLPREADELRDHLRGAQYPVKQKRDIWVYYCKCVKRLITKDDIKYIVGK